MTTGKTRKWRYSKKEDAFIVEQYNTGKTVVEISKTLGRSYRALTTRIHVLRKKYPSRLISPKEHRRMITLGENNPNYGKIHTEEARRKMSEANIGNTIWLGKKHAEESKEKMSKARKIYAKEHGSPRKGVKLTEETKEKIRKKAHERFRDPLEREKVSKIRKERGLAKGRNNPMFGKAPQFPKSKWHKKGVEELGHPVKSSYEFEFSEFLQEEGLSYEYEPCSFPMTIEGKEVTYAPDFYIPRYDIYVELKGYDGFQDGLAAKKVEEFKKLHADIILIDAKEFEGKFRKNRRKSR